MAPVIWGLDLKEIHPNKFKSSNMWSNVYHLRKTKFIVYQIAMVLMVCSESCGTAAIDDYIHQQRNFEHSFTPRGPSIYNNDLVGIASYNIFVGIAVATVFGAGFFFDLFWPERAEAPWVKRAWKASAVVVCAMVLADALAMTVIVVMHEAHLEGLGGLAGGLSAARGVLDGLKSPNPPLEYKNYAKCVASICLLWPGAVATFAATFVLFQSAKYQRKYGVFSKHYRVDSKEKADHDAGEASSTSASVQATAAQ